MYLEKPMARDAEEAGRVLEAVENSNKKLVVAHYRRRLPLYRRVKEILRRGDLGQPRYVSLKAIQPENDPLIASSEEYWRVNPEISGGGIFHDLSPHQLDLMLDFFGEPSSINGTSSRRLQSRRLRRLRCRTNIIWGRHGLSGLLGFRFSGRHDCRRLRDHLRSRSYTF